MIFLSYGRFGAEVSCSRRPKNRIGKQDRDSIKDNRKQATKLKEKFQGMESELRSGYGEFLSLYMTLKFIFFQQVAICQ